MNNLKEDLKKKNPATGAAEVLKGIIKGKTSKVYVSSNCPEKERILNLVALNKVNVVELKENNKELGNLCKKPFSVSAISFE